MGFQPTFIDRSMTNNKVVGCAHAEIFGLNCVEEYRELARSEGENHKPKIEKTLGVYAKQSNSSHRPHLPSKNK